MNNRIRLIRKQAGLSQTEFGERIGVKQTTIAGYENGSRVPIDAVVQSVCREFNVSELWLRTGEGDMYEEKSIEEEIAEFSRSVITSGSDSFRARFIAALTKLTPEGWAVLQQIAEEMQKSSDTKPDD